MDKVLGNFTTQPNRDFPFDCETLKSLQDNTLFTAILGNIAGDKTIISGCALKNNGLNRDPGYVFVKTAAYPDGELLYFEGGNVSVGMYVKLQDVAVSARGNNYPKAYTKRSLASGIGTENFSWADFKQIQSNAQLGDRSDGQDQAIAAIAPPPLGIVQMWAGLLTAIPENYRLCDGSSLPAADYPGLFAALGTAHGGVGNNFNLPDLRSRFIVGYDERDNDYNALAKTGGLKSVTLTAAQSGVAGHVHVFEWRGYPQSGGAKFEQRISRGGGVDNAIEQKNTNANDEQDAREAHENRPPYYTLAYIIRVK